MFRNAAGVVCAAACLFLLVGCIQVAGPVPPVAPTPAAGLPSITVTTPNPQANATPATGAQPLSPDAAADYTTGDTARLAGGEFVGDQADLTVLEAVAVPAPSADMSRYAFLVEITGLDSFSFPYNLLDFRLIDDQDFQYAALPDGGEGPRLEFGDLAHEQKVRGWITFDVPTDNSKLRLEYNPDMALEAATFGFLVP
jgi:hypothetical protein